jgi:phytanoyl-CoA hydroxylase
MKVLSDQQYRQFVDDGYVVVDNVIDPQGDIEPIMNEYMRILGGIAASLYKNGEIRSLYEELPFGDRMIQICAESGRNFPKFFDISLPLKNCASDSPIYLGPAAFRLMTSDRLLDAIEDILGPEIYSNPVQHIRMKLPKRAVAAAYSRSSAVAASGWHQDNGVVLEEADQATILTVWVPLNRATIDNGCLQVIPGSHRSDLIDHCPTDNGMRIPDKLLPLRPPRPLPMSAGGVIFMNQRTVHSSLDNTTDDEVRMSFDLRYQPTGQPTGRPAFPGFVARSSVHPQSAFTDPAQWAKLWLDARARLANAPKPQRFSRWNSDSPVCA